MSSSAYPENGVPANTAKSSNVFDFIRCIELKVKKLMLQM